MANGVLKEAEELRRAEELAAGAAVARDIRSRRPLFLRLLASTAWIRAVLRVAALFWLDMLGVYLGILTALEAKVALTTPDAAGTASALARDLAPLAVLVTVLLFARSGLYRERSVRPGLTRVIGCLFQATVVIFLYALAEREDFSSYYIFYGSLFFAIVYVGGFRWFFERVSGVLLRAAGYRRRAVLVGSGSHIEAVAQALENSVHSEFEPVGYISLTPLPESGLHDLGTLDGLERHLDSIDEVLIADPDFPQEKAVELVDRCQQTGVRVRVAPSTMEILMDRIEFVPGETVPLFELKPPVFEGVDFVVKRTFDIVVSLVLIVVLAPALALIALAVKLASRGPVIYRSMRPGIGGKTFSCLKFRTMYADADERQPELEALNEKRGPIFKIKGDPRVTPVGAFLRRWSLDELPQLFNVVRGEMSLVGPRPLPQRDYDRLDDWHRKRYLVLPGMTGLWQISGRSQLDFDELVRLDFLYLEDWSVFLDLSILVKTIPAVIRTRGAW